MKKILTTLACGVLFSTTLMADVARVEMGAGAWMQSPSGSVSATNGDGLLKMNGTYTSAEDSTTEPYLWVLIKHPIPVLPNIRLEYVSLSDVGSIAGTINGASAGNAKATLDMKQYDIIPYYNILDNTAWITLDLGLDIKIIQEKAEINNLVAIPTQSSDYSSSETVAIPLVYARLRIEIPATDIGLESDIKYITYDNSTIYDVRAKIDYTFDITPLIQPGIEVGYRIQSYDANVDDVKGELKFSGFYAGLMLRF